MIEKHPLQGLTTSAQHKLPNFLHGMPFVPSTVISRNVRIFLLLLEEAEDEGWNESAQKWLETRMEAGMTHTRYFFKSASDTASEAAFIAHFLAQNIPSS